MSSSQNPVPQPPQSAPSSQPKVQADSLTDSDTSVGTTMDQLLASTLTMDSSASSSTSDVTSPTEPTPTSPATQPDAETETAASADLSLIGRPHPIPPASEPMQYRAIGLVRGTYTPSEEQFTRGNLVDENGLTIDAVLLGRVMSLVRKHIDLAEPHLWVVYPRTRNKDEALHLQIVGVWEPEKLNKFDDGADADQDDDADLSDGADQAEDVAIAPDQADDQADDELVDQADDQTDEQPAEQATEQPAAQATDAAATDTPAPADAIADAETAPTATKPVAIAPIPPTPPTPPTPPNPPVAPLAAPVATTAATPGTPGAIALATDGTPDLTDGYFSIRGEVLAYTPDNGLLTVKIQQSARKGDKQGKSFQLNLTGQIEGKVVGYFWDFHVQRQAADLIVQESNKIALVPPKRKPKREMRGGRPGGGSRPPYGAKRRDFKPRDGQSPHGGDRAPHTSERPNLAARRDPLPKPVKRPKDSSSAE